MKVRKTLATLGIAATIGAGIVLPAPPANAYVSLGGARADTILVCNRSLAYYAVGPQAQGFAWVRTYILNSATGRGTWSNWMNPTQLGNSGMGLPVAGRVAVYAQYALHDGTSWRYTGEWARVVDRNGNFASYYC